MDGNSCTECPVLEIYMSCPYKGKLDCANSLPERAKLRKGEDQYEDDEKTDRRDW